MTKATMRPHRIGRLANHHRANSAVTTGTVAPATPYCDMGTRSWQ
jgi:hypothetical protein